MQTTHTHTVFCTKHTHYAHARTQIVCHWPVLNTELPSAPEYPPNREAFPKILTQCKHTPAPVSQYTTVLRAAHLSAAVSPPRVKHPTPPPPPPDHLPAELTAARRRRGKPRSGLDSAIALAIRPFPPRRSPGSPRRRQQQGRPANLRCSVRAGPAERTSVDALQLGTRDDDGDGGLRYTHLTSKPQRS